MHADVDCVPYLETPTECSKGLDTKIRLADREPGDYRENIAFLNHGCGKLQVSGHTVQRGSREHRRVPAWSGQCDRANFDERSAGSIKDVLAEHVVARRLPCLLGDFRSKLTTLFRTGLGRVDNERFDWDFKSETAFSRAPAGSNLTMHPPGDDMIVTEASKRPGTIDKQPDFGGFRIHDKSRRVRGNHDLRTDGSRYNGAVPGWRHRLARCEQKERE